MTCDDDYTCRPIAGRGLCEFCTSDEECGGPDDLCLPFAGSDIGVVDHGCGRLCSDQSPCPAGYRCAALGGLNQCVPYNSQQVITCAAIRDMGKACELIGGDQCGVPGVDDALCVPDVQQSYCSVTCRSNAPNDAPMCIAGWQCANWGQFSSCTPL